MKRAVQRVIWGGAAEVCWALAGRAWDLVRWAESQGRTLDRKAREYGRRSVLRG